MARPPSDEAFTEFVVASWPSLYRTAYLVLGDRGLAEDLVQTALAQTYPSWGRIREVGAARGYARTTMANTAATRSPGSRRRRPRPTPWHPARAPGSAPAPAHLGPPTGATT